MLAELPGPKGYPILGNILDVRDEVPINGLVNLADKYGPIYKITLYGAEFVVVSSVKLLEELSDETRFHKVLSPGLESVRQEKASGLFAARSEEDPDWIQAHRILMPAFGPLAITTMFDEMYDIATQLVLKWARKEPEDIILATEDFTRLTLDTIALCSMDYRFNSFYRTDMHPFVQAMTRTLSAGNGPSTVFGVLRLLAGGKQENVKKDRALMESIASELVQHRRQNCREKRDLLYAMINGKDPKTGESMRDDLITANITSFLVAGHETTSGLLSFALAHLLKTPAALQTAQAEVDNIVGQEKLQVHHLKKLSYLNAVLRETLRLNPTVPAYVRQIRPDNKEPTPSLGGYAIDRNWKIYALVTKSGRDPEVFGEDAHEFRPERMLDTKFDDLPKSAWKPFGTGARACIGRAFAWQEALLALALLLQSFDIQFDDPHYDIHIKQTLTVKPRDLYIKVRPRRGKDVATIQKCLLAGVREVSPDNLSNECQSGASAKERQELLVLFGSNTGTCQTLAQRLASDAKSHGYRSRVADMDSGLTAIEQAKKVVIVTASYEGQPPDNASHFVEWLNTNVENKEMNSLQYSVFGCGHSDWASTFLKIPTLVDQQLERARATRLTDMGHSDAAKGDIFGDFDDWADSNFWPAITNLDEAGEAGNEDSKVRVEIKTQDRTSQLRQDVKAAVVQKATVLTAPREPEKRHLEILLPSDMTYEPGDYLSVLPLNPDANVQRVMSRYHIPWDATIIVKSSGSTVLPLETPTSISSLLKGYVELAQPATKRDIRSLVDFASDESTKTVLRSYIETNYESEILVKRVSILDLLCNHPGIELPFEELLSLLPPMRLRYYSISSSPLVNPTICTITCAVIDGPSLSGAGHFTGVAGSYLKSLQPGNSLQVAVRSTSASFRLPLRVKQTPIVMICAGTGLAPFRGFVQQRAELIKAGHQDLAPALLFLGCRWSDRDRLYAEEMDTWSASGAVDIRYAFSREEDHPKSQGCKYVQDRMLEAKTELHKLWEMGSKIFVCGSPEMAKSVTAMAKRLVTDRLSAEGKQVQDEKLEEWFLRQKGDRFVTDIFG